MFAVIAASTVSTIYFAEKLWRQNCVAAVVVVAAINGTTAAISMHNARVRKTAGSSFRGSVEHRVVRAERS